MFVHALLFNAMLLGSHAQKTHKLEDHGPGASGVAGSAEPTMTLVQVNLPGVVEQSLNEDLSSRGPELADLAIEIFSANPLPALDISESQIEEVTMADSSQSAGDPAARALLFGRYTGQIDARIQRAWRRPRSPVEEPIKAIVASAQSETNAPIEKNFHCQARITQDARGNVREVELMNCNGTPAWQLSLVNAVQQASPLPAPPSPTVFTNALTLSFEAHEYVEGENDGYETVAMPVENRLASVSTRDPQSPDR